MSDPITEQLGERIRRLMLYREGVEDIGPDDPMMPAVYWPAVWLDDAIAKLRTEVTSLTRKLEEARSLLREWLTTEFSEEWAAGFEEHVRSALGTDEEVGKT